MLKREGNSASNLQTVTEATVSSESYLVATLPTYEPSSVPLFTTWTVHSRKPRAKSSRSLSDHKMEYGGGVMLIKSLRATVHSLQSLSVVLCLSHW